MPYINVKVTARRSPAMAQRIASVLINNAVQSLTAKPHEVAITIEFVSADDWFVNGRSLADESQSGVQVEVGIADDTSTRRDKQAFIREVFADFARVLGDLHDTSYVSINELPPGAFGYGGLTQEQRYRLAGSGRVDDEE